MKRNLMMITLFPLPKKLETQTICAEEISRTKTNVCVHADSFTCVGKMKDNQEKSKNGEVKCKDWAWMQWESMEKQMNLNGISPLDFHLCLDLERTSNPTRRIQGPNHLHVSVQWHWVETEWWELYFECRESQELRDENLAKTFDIHGTGVGRKIVWKFLSCAHKGELGFCSRRNDTALSSSFPTYQRIETRNLEAAVTSMDIRWTQNSCSKQFIL